MVSTSINLLEGFFPILVNREDLISEDLTKLGELIKFVSEYNISYINDIIIMHGKNCVYNIFWN